METSARVTPGSNDTSRTLARGVDQAGSGAHGAIEAASETVRPGVDRVAAGAHRAVDRIAAAADQAVQALGDKGEQLKSAQVRVMDQCRGYVTANPLTALGIAAAAGYLLSRLLHPR